jgi:hypothetical protein
MDTVNTNETANTDTTANQTRNEDTAMQPFQTFPNAETVLSGFDCPRNAVTAYTGGTLVNGVALTDLWTLDAGYNVGIGSTYTWCTHLVSNDKTRTVFAVTLFNGEYVSYGEPQTVTVSQHLVTFERNEVAPMLVHVAAPTITESGDVTYRTRHGVNALIESYVSPVLFVFEPGSFVGRVYRTWNAYNPYYNTRLRTVNDPVYGPSYATAAVTDGCTLYGASRFQTKPSYLWVQPSDNEVYDAITANLNGMSSEVNTLVYLVCYAIHPTVGYGFKVTEDGFVSYNEDAKPDNSTRKKMKFGRFLRKCGNAIGLTFSDVAIETVAHAFTTAYTPQPTQIEEWRGEDILHAYHEDNYVRGITTGSLHGSCMRYDYAQEYVAWYAENPQTVSILVCVDDNRTIYGRALLWTTPNGDKHLDRIYGNETVTSDIETYATERGYNRRTYQDWFYMAPSSTGYYPYMDTYCYYSANRERLQAFYSSGFAALTGTDGNYEPTTVECTQCGYDGERDDMFSPDGDYICEDCYSSGVCEDCETYDRTTEERTTATGNYRRLCESCADSLTCSQCGELQNAHSDIDYHAGLSSDVCTDCAATHCNQCGDECDETNEDTALCDACQGTAPCLNCGEPRSQYDRGDYCIPCKPRQTAIAAFQWCGYSTFNTWNGVCAYEQPRNDEETANAGFDVNMVRDNHQRWINRTRVTAYVPQPRQMHLDDCSTTGNAFTVPYGVNDYLTVQRAIAYGEVQTYWLQ